MTLDSGSGGTISIGGSNATTSIGRAGAALTLYGSYFTVTNGGAVGGVTGYTQDSGNFIQNGAGTFGTGTGAVSLNGNTTIASTKTLTLSDNISQGGSNLIYNGDFRRAADGWTNANGSGTVSQQAVSDS